jgi:hypothetical protein
MVSRWRLGCCVLLLALLLQAPSPAAVQRPAGASEPIAVRAATVDGVTLQYLTAGHGPAILLLHGYAETSRMWRPLTRDLLRASRSLPPTCPGSGAQAFRRTAWT